MSNIKKYLIAGTVICATAVCAYNLLLNDKAKNQLKDSANSLVGSIKKIMKYQEVLVDDGSTNKELLYEHQQRIQNSWEQLGY